LIDFACEDLQVTKINMETGLKPKITLATVGDNCIDRYFHLGKSAVGGNAVNVAVHLVKLGWPCAYFGAVGDDPDGRRTKKVLAENNVDLSHLQTITGATSFTNLDIDGSGERIITHENFGVCENYRLTADNFSDLSTRAHIHIGWFNHSIELRDRLKGYGVSFSQDIAVNQQGGGLDVAFESVGPSKVAAERKIDELLAAGNKLAVVTCGSLGSMASDGINIFTTGVKPVEIVDTTGAGDTFIAGFLGAWLTGKSLLMSLEAGRDNAANTCRHLGGFDQAYEEL
jgi:fructoselysine 6-kinase